MSDEAPQRSPLPAYLALLLACAWLLAGAVTKLWVASPSDIPPVVLEHARSWFGLGMIETYRWAVTIELAVVSLVLVRPRWGWFVLAGQYAVFLVVLANLMLGGATSCGCFGGVIRVEPWEMMAVDAPLLLLLLASTPWRRLPRTPLGGARLGALLVLWAGSFLAPRVLVDLQDGGRGPNGPRPGEAQGTTPPAGIGDDATDGGSDAADPGAQGPGTQDPSATTSDPVAGTPPEGPGTDPTAASTQDLPMFVELHPDRWEGQMVDQVDWASWLDGHDPFELPETCHVIVYRKTCEVCRDHLTELATTNPVLDRPVVLLRIPDANDAEAVDVLDVKPEAFLDVDLVPLSRGYGITTPMSFDLEGYVIQNVVDVRAQRGH